MAQQVIKDAGIILATTFEGEEVVAPILYQSQVLLAAGGTTKAGRVLACLVVRVELREGFMAAVHMQAVGWSPSPCSASPAAFPAPPPSAPVQTKPNCLYLFVGSDDAGGGLSKLVKKSFLVHAVKKMGAAAAGRKGQDLSVHVNKVFHPNTLACWQRGLCGKQRTKKLRIT